MNLKKNSKVSVIVPVYNCFQNVTKCIDSITAQTYDNLEVIIVDDGSTDNSYELCKQLEKIDNRIKVYTKKNGGPSSARNYGINKATGDYIFFIDSDDYLDVDVIEKLLINAKLGTLVGVMHKNIDKTKEKIIKYESMYSVKDFVMGIIDSNVGGFCWGYLFDSKLMKNINFDEKTYYMEDTLFLVDYLSKVENICFIENSYYNYIIYSNGITKSNKVISNIKSFCYSLELIEKRLKLLNDNSIHDKINNKKMKLIEAEFSKLSSTKEIYSAFHDGDLNNIIQDLSKLKSIKGKYKLFIILFLNKNVFLFKVYSQIRKTLKKIKNFI